jgi:hypothetical protein
MKIDNGKISFAEGNLIKSKLFKSSKTSITILTLCKKHGNLNSE